MQSSDRNGQQVKVSSEEIKRMISAASKASKPQTVTMDSAAYVVFEFSDLTIALQKTNGKVKFHAMNFEVVGINYVLMDNREVLVIDSDWGTYTIEDPELEHTVSSWIQWRTSALENYKV